jgi:hypothetical protein
MGNEKKPKSVTVRPSDAIHVQTTTFPVNILITASFARYWLDDALIEAKKESSRDSKRREIVFAVCFAETYIFEWVRNKFFPKDIEGLFHCFTTPSEKGGRRPKNIKEKWKVTKQLSEDGKIKDTIVFDKGKNVVWGDFCDLIDYRNSLVHAALSIPESSSPPELIKKLPTISDFNRMKIGWATGVVVNLVRHFHEVIGIKPPDWFEDNIKNFK